MSTRFHIHAILYDACETDEELANVTVTLEAESDDDAEQKFFALFPDHAMDIQEIEVADA